MNTNREFVTYYLLHRELNPLFNYKINRPISFHFHITKTPFLLSGV